MERREFIQKSTLVTSALATGAISAAAKPNQNTKEVYELRVYEMKRNMAPFESYYTKALIPALNRLGVKNVGAFTEIAKPEPPMVYILIPYQSFDTYVKVKLNLPNDEKFKQDSAEYNQLPVDQSVYHRYESSLLLAFDGLPAMRLPPQKSRIFELRTYEGYSEDAVSRKIKMFNEGEIEIFDRVKLNSVFFGEMLAGKNLPCITYMLSFKDMEERDKNWKDFSADEEWKKISKAPEYANTVSKIYRTFLEPLPYSQI